MFFAVVALACCLGTTAQGGTVNGTRSGRWYKGDDDQQQVSVQLGYYAAPDTPVYTIDTPDGKRKDGGGKPPKNIPTSFDDFMPDKKGRYGGYPADWKGAVVATAAGDDDNAPWMFPTDMLDLMTALKKGDDKPTGLLDKLKAEPVALFFATLVPLTLIMMAVLPSLNKLIASAMPNVVTTTAAGNGSRQLRREDDPGFVSDVLEAVESLRLQASEGCWKRKVCQLAKRINGTEFKSLKDVFGYFDESWLGRLGVRDLVEAVTDSGKCDNIPCPEKPSKYILYDELNGKKRKSKD